MYVVCIPIVMSPHHVISELRDGSQFIPRTGHPGGNFFFQDLEAEGKVDMTSEMNKECLWYCFSGVLQSDCDSVKDHWNTHYIRHSRHNTVRGRPDSFFFYQNITVLQTIFC